MKKKIQKPFDAEAAKRGATVETRSGRSVRIICYNKKGIYPIVALVAYGDDETYFNYNVEGKYIRDRCSDDDLVLVEEVECPKFKEGDYVVLNQNYTYKVNYVDTMYHTYHLVCINNNSFIRPDIEEIDKSCHKWTIKDAVPGDVLIRTDGKFPFIFQNSQGCALYAYCGLDATESLVIAADSSPWIYINVRPATSDEQVKLFDGIEKSKYSWDAESLTLTKKRWRDKDSNIYGYYITSNSAIDFAGKCSAIDPEDYNVFVTEKQAKSALAMARISQIMANDKRFGSPITDEEWDGRTWYCIVRVRKLLIVEARSTYDFLAFHTKDQAELFVDENKNLVKDYYMLG